MPWRQGVDDLRLCPMTVNSNPVAMDDVRRRMADNLRRIRKERGLSQERLALEAGVDRTMLSKIERRIANPSIETLLKLSNRLAVDLRDLLSPEPKPQIHADGERYRPDRASGFAASPIVVHEPRRNLR